MKSKEMIQCLLIVGSLAAVTGCGKTEKTASPQKEPPATTRTEPAAPPPAAATEARQIAGAPTTGVDTVNTTMQAAAQATEPSAMMPTQAPPAVTEAAKPAGAAAPSPAGLSQDEMVKGLQEALGKGLQQAIAGLGHDGGFLTNLNVKIPLPDKMQKVETALRAMKQEKLADEFVATMNHAAEQAVPEAASVFADALKQMTIADAQSILGGPDDAATQYFQKTTQTNLYGRFYPIVQKATQAVGVTAAYKKAMDAASGSETLGNLGSLVGGSLLGKEALDIDAYVTNKALDGLFKMIAAEEKQIRQSPIARTTGTLQKVFGMLQK